MRSASLLFVLFCILSCRKNDPGNVPLPGSCEFTKESGWTVAVNLHNANARIVRDFRRDSVARHLLVLKEPPLTVFSCNLPEAFKADSIQVIISGKIYTHPTIDLDYLPLELTAIALAD